MLRFWFVCKLLCLSFKQLINWSYIGFLCEQDYCRLSTIVAVCCLQSAVVWWFPSLDFSLEGLRLLLTVQAHGTVSQLTFKCKTKAKSYNTAIVLHTAAAVALFMSHTELVYSL